MTKEARICNGTKTASLINGTGKTGELHVKDLNIRPETIKLLEENIGRTLNDINQNKILYDAQPRVTEIKQKINN